MGVVASLARRAQGGTLHPALSAAPGTRDVLGTCPSCYYCWVMAVNQRVPKTPPCPETPDQRTGKFQAAGAPQSRQVWSRVPLPSFLPTASCLPAPYPTRAFLLPSVRSEGTPRKQKLRSELSPKGKAASLVPWCSTPQAAAGPGPWSLERS